MLLGSPIATTQYFIRTHMEQRNLEEALDCLTEDISWFGTGAFEVVHGKEEAKDFLMDEIDLFPEGYDIEFLDMSETMVGDSIGTVFGQLLVTDKKMGSQINCRITATCIREKENFLISSLHMSLPTELQNDGEYYPLTIAEQKLQQLKNSFFNTTIPGGLICCDVGDGYRVRYVNDFFVKLLGYDDKEDFLLATGGFFENCLSKKEDIKSIKNSVQAMKINQHGTFTYCVKTKFGSEIWIRDYKQKYESNGQQWLMCFCVDISDIIQLERRLKEEAKRLEFANAEGQAIISNIPGGVHRCQLFDTIKLDYVSQGLEKMSGYTGEEIHRLFKDDYSMLLVEEDRKEFSEAISNLSKEADAQVLEYRMCRKDGTVIRVVDHFQSVVMEDGKIWGFGVATDVTPQYETVARLKLLTDTIPGGIGVYEYSGKGLESIYVSDGVCNMLGYTKEEYQLLAKNDLKSMVFEDDIEGLFNEIQMMLIGKTDEVDCIYRMRTKNGSYRWRNLRGTVGDRHSGVVRINAAFLDITDSKEYEETIRIRDQEYTLALKQSGKIVYRYNIEEKAVYMLQKSVDLFGFPPYSKNIPDSIVNMDWFTPQSRKDFFEFHEAIIRGEKNGSVTLCRKLKSGEYGWCCAYFTTLYNSVGKSVSAIVSIEDVTKQHQQELENEILKQNEELFQIVVSHSDRFIVKFDIKTRTVYAFPHTSDAFSVGKVLNNVPYSNIESGRVGEESIQTAIDFFDKLVAGESTAKAIIKMRRSRKTQEWGWYQFDGSVIVDDKGEPIYAVVSFIEITEQYEKELAYERVNQHIGRLSQDAMLYFEANLTEMKIEHSGGHWLCNLEKNLEGDLDQLMETCINKMIYFEDRQSIREFFDKDKLLASYAEGQAEREGEYRILDKGKPRWVYITIEMITDPYTENILLYILFKDIDKSKTKEIKILKQAEMDGLTNVYNRSTIEWQVRHIIKTSRDEKYIFIIADMDDLKTINDTFGHMEGDHAIIMFAEVLKKFAGENNLVGRMGGDEFILLCGYNSETEVIQSLESLVKEMHKCGIEKYHIKGSFGVIASNGSDETFESLYKKADIALYYVKRNGKNNYAFYREDMEEIEQNH
ncbi:MAG: PAS domain-containing protein [Anaerovoracaceae bacterium]